MVDEADEDIAQVVVAYVDRDNVALLVVFLIQICSPHHGTEPGHPSFEDPLMDRRLYPGEGWSCTPGPDG